MRSAPRVSRVGVGVAVVLVTMWATIATAHADDPPSAPAAAPRKLVVGTTPVAPFIVKNADGTFSGISIEVFQLVAAAANVTYELKEISREQLVSGENDADVVVSLNISEKGEKVYDMSHAFYSTGLGIAVANEQDSAPWWKGLLTRRLARSALILFALLLVAGVIMWMIERRKNEDEFGGRGGLIAGLFWAVEAVVGYNDPQHKTRWGRLFGITWAFAGVIVISSVTASIAAEMTASRLVSRVKGPADLQGVRVGVVKVTQGKRYCERRGLACADFDDVGPALDALARGEVDAVVGESPILRYEVQKAHAADVHVLAGTFENHGYGFGIKTGEHELRETLNRALLEVMISDQYAAVFTRYLGASE